MRSDFSLKKLELDLLHTIPEGQGLEKHVRSLTGKRAESKFFHQYFPRPFPRTRRRSRIGSGSAATMKGREGEGRDRIG